MFSSVVVLNPIREIVALMIAKEIASRPAESLEKAVDRAVRVGLAVLTIDTAVRARRTRTS